MPVGISKCSEYDYETVEKTVRRLFELIGLDGDFFRGKKVVVKPNLVAAVSPDNPSVTHPSVTCACAKIAREGGGDVVIAESPGGLYTEAVLKNLYKVTGTENAAERAGVRLNYDTSYGPFEAEKGVVSRYFEIITPIIEADVILDVCKLKSHTLTLLSANVKNLFGCVPGVFKAEQHARFKNQDDFKIALVDLAHSLCAAKKVICVTDAVVAMEGNGPTGGRPVKTGCLIASDNIFEADVVCAGIIGQSGDGAGSTGVKMLKEAFERGLCPADSGGVDIRGDSFESVVCREFLQPDTNLKKWFDVVPKWLSPKPKINLQKCVGCGRCAEVCPQKTIRIEKKDKRKYAKINYKNCIHCFCCQELCPIHAVDIKKFFIFKFVK